MQHDTVNSSFIFSQFSISVLLFCSPSRPGYGFVLSADHDEVATEPLYQQLLSLKRKAWTSTIRVVEVDGLENKTPS